MTAIGPLLMFGGMFVVVAIADRLPIRPHQPDREAELLGELQERDEQMRDEYERADREKDYAGAPAWVLEQ